MGRRRDTTPPDTSITGGPSGSINQNSATFTFTGSDNVTSTANLRYSYNLDGGAWSTPSTSTSASLTGLGAGAHTFNVRAVDQANNVDSTPASRSFSVATTTTTTRIRKNQANLTANERAAFVSAVKALKSDGRYDMIVNEHRTAMLSIRPDPAHGGPAFFAWHRECLRRYELLLQSVNPSVTLPYWDWTRDGSATSSIWGADFMGGNGDASSDWRVTSGPFAYSTGEWTLTVNDTPDTPPYLRRTFGLSGDALPTSTQVNSALTMVPYDASPWNFDTDINRSFRKYTEWNIHDVTHRWVGGNMLQAASPNDPVFFLHHCNLDRLWAMWQRRNATEPYLPSSGGPTGHNIDDPMWPWASESNPPTPRKMLDHRALGYTYDDEASW